MTESIVMTNPLPTIPWGSNLDSPSEQNPFEIPTRESGIGFTGHDEDDVVIQVDLERDWSQSVRQSVDNMTRSVETNVEPSTAEGKGYKPNLYLAAFFVSASGWLFGFDTGSIGPVTEMEHFYPLSAGLQGFVVATILLTALIFSPPAGPLSEKVSRLHAITIGDSIFALGSLICASSQNLGMYLAGRAIAGAGEGLFLSTVGVWLVEAAPKEKRGRVACMSQFLIICGVAGGYFICYGAVTIDSTWQWRIPYCCQTAVAIFLAIMMQTRIVPESPRWLLLRSATPQRAIPIIEAFATTSHSAEIEKAELLLRTEKEREERELAQNGGKKSFMQSAGLEGWSECFEKKQDRRWKSLVGIAFMGIQQLSGIDAVLFYAPIIFTSAGLSSKQGSFLASGITGILGIAVMIPCQFYLVDKVGRRPATIWGGVGMGVCMLTIGILFASGLADEHKAAKWTIIGLIYVFIALFQATWSIVIKVYANEIQPNATRASASSLAQCFNWIVNIVIALSTPAFLKRSPSGPYFLFGACCIVGALMGLTMPETKGLSMQGIDDAWDTQKTHLKGNLLQLKKFVGLEEQPPTVEQVQMEDLDQSRNHQE